jgi:gamma-glutamyltranspeptidase/glutathione hydrolase
MRRSRVAAGVALAVFLAGCTSLPFMDDEPEVPLGTVGHVSGFFGGAAADEPQAVLAGRDVLAAGGSAADAALAMYFTLAVTLPSSAGLGGGGICLSRPNKEQRIETLDFLGQPSSGPGTKVLVPGNPRGIFALHAKSGKLNWGELIRPAENLARFGFRISRAFAEGLKLGQAVLAASPEARALFSKPDGSFVGEGDQMRRPKLAAFLARMRSHGPANIHVGAGADLFAAEAERLGFGITSRDLKATRPFWRSTIRVGIDAERYMHFPLPRTPQGTMGAKMAAVLLEGGRYADAAPDQRAHLVAEAIQRAYADQARGFKQVDIKKEFGSSISGRRTVDLTYTQIDNDYVEGLMRGYRSEQLTELAVSPGPELPIGRRGGETSFAVIDRDGGAVACAFSMNGPFGTGRLVPDSGIFVARYQSSTAVRDLSLAVLMIEHRYRDKLFMAAAATGGVSSQAVLTQVAVASAVSGITSVENPISRGRVFRDPVRRITYVEQDAGAEFANTLLRRGHRLQTVPGLSRANIVHTGTGLPIRSPRDPIEFNVETDPRGFGLAISPG